MGNKILPAEEYYNSLPRKITSSAVLLFKDDKILILETNYQKSWSIPGGVVESGEAFLQAAIRETMEEIGCEVIIKRLLCIDYGIGSDISGDATHLIFYGDIGDQQVKPCNDEIISYSWLEANVAIPMLSNALGKRVSCAIKALNDDKIYYCENGQIIEYK